jgi:hypothetical protein
MNQYSEIELYKKLDELRRQHRVIEDKINVCEKQNPEDIFTVQRFKKEKLAIRDKITRIESEIYPDIIA